MAESIDNSLLTKHDPRDSQYISDVVNQVLAKGDNLSSVKDFQSALKEVSTAQGREVQLNLVTDKKQIVGFNFSFKDIPHKSTPTISLTQQQIDGEKVEEKIISQLNQPRNTDVTATDVEGDIVPSSKKKREELNPTLPLMPISTLPIDSPEKLNSSAPGLPMNLDLHRAAQQLASSNELNGLWIAGTALKPMAAVAKLLETTVAATAKFLDTEEKPDIQSAGQAVIKRFEQVLPQQFEQLKNGESPKPFTWKDSHSGKSYCFEFEVATPSPGGKPLTPATLRGFEESVNELKPVFSAQLVEPKSNLWSIEQCDFNPVQLRSLSVADKPSHLRLDTNNLPKKTHASTLDLLEL
jgi:hypothetical protein